MKRTAIIILTALGLMGSLSACHEKDFCYREGLVLPITEKECTTLECMRDYYGPECTIDGDWIACPTSYVGTAERYIHCRDRDSETGIMHCPVIDLSGMEMCYHGYWREFFYTVIPTYEWWKTCKYGCNRKDIRELNQEWCDYECLGDVNYHDYDEEYHAQELAELRDHDSWDDDDDD